MVCVFICNIVACLIHEYQFKLHLPLALQVIHVKSFGAIHDLIRSFNFHAQILLLLLLLLLHLLKSVTALDPHLAPVPSHSHTHTHTHSHTRTHMCRIEGSVCNGFVCCAALLLHLIKTLKCRRTIAVRVATVHSVAWDAGRERDRDRDRDRGTSEGKLCVCACVGQIGKPTTK